ncbi:MAG: hypothetical protein LBH51_06140 [Treponema sp.]|jgi:hypothetical protein|nr:hypothetical protein [Treponema sp.]
MRSLLNFILANLVPLIVVVAVILRIINSMKAVTGKKAAPAALGDQEEGGEDDAWSRLRPDEDEGDAAGYAAPRPAARPAAPSPDPAIRPLLMPASLLDGPPSPPPASLDPVIAPPFDPVSTAPAAEGRPPAGAPGPGPLDRLNRLSPLRRAVVLAEILGKPRGMEDAGFLWEER